jgi:hypothetical protein
MPYVHGRSLERFDFYVSCLTSLDFHLTCSGWKSRNDAKISRFAVESDVAYVSDTQKNSQIDSLEINETGYIVEVSRYPLSWVQYTNQTSLSISQQSWSR